MIPKGLASGDDCEFIRRALKNLRAEGGEVTIPEGSYTCSAPLVLDKNNVSLRGKGLVTLRLADHSNAPVIIMGDAQTPPRPVKNIKVSHLLIEGNKDNQDEECWGGPCDEGGTTFVRNNGITVRAVTNGVISDVYITEARSGGVVTEHGVYNLKINHLTSTYNYFDGFAGYETYGAVLDHLNLAHNHAAGISIDIDFSKNTIKDSVLSDNGDVGIFMRDSNSNLFENVLIEKSGNHGVFVSAVNDETTCPKNNEFHDLKVISSNGVGFRLNSGCPNNRLSGENRFVGNRDQCISEEVAGSLKVRGSVICRP